jgi:hypothetical protein
LDERFPNLSSDELVFTEGLLPILDVTVIEHPPELVMGFSTGT